MTPVGGLLAEKLNRLFDSARTPGQPPLSNAAAAEAIHAQTGVPISAAYLWQLRSGLKSNPTISHVQAIAEFFRVPTAYLIDPGVDHDLEREMVVMHALRDAGVLDLAVRASGLTPAALAHLSGMIDHARALENLPPVRRRRRHPASATPEGDTLDP